ncbi:MAG: META domain-containing protein [Pseudomonadota bacterium]
MIGFLFFMLFLAGFALVALQGRQQAGQQLGEGAARWVGTDWRPVNADSEVSVRFDADGSVSGFGGCNEFFGAIERTDQTLAVGPLGTTRRACAEDVMARERSFLKALESLVAIDREDNALLLRGEDGDLLLRLEPVPAT